jgi:hypothetical protein
MQTNQYAATRAEARVKKFPGLKGAKRLAERLGCGEVVIYLWEKPGHEHLPKNRFTRKAYLRAIGVKEESGKSAAVAP